MFREEYMDMLKKSQIDFDEKYLFDWYGLNISGLRRLVAIHLLYNPTLTRRATDM